MATEKVSIELNLRGYEGVYDDLQKLDRMLQGFSGPKGKKTIELDLGAAKKDLLALSGEIHDAEESVESYRRKVRDLKKELRDLRKAEGDHEDAIKAKKDEIDDMTDALDDQRDKLSDLRTEYKDLTQRVNEYNNALKNSQRSWGDIYKRTSTGLKHVGQNMQTLGNVLTRIGSPFNRITTGLLYGAGFKALNLATEGLGNAFSRYDTMRKYEQIMASYEKANYSAKKSKEELDTAVQGLPTGLDEIMGVAQRFTATSGDIEKGTKLAIATNNAFLASMSTETQRYQGMMQMQDVIGGKDMGAKEWQALANSMMPAIRKIGETLGYEGEQLNDYVANVQQGKIANEDFVDALIKAGYGTESTLGKIAEVSKQTWESLQSNTKIAFARLGEAVLTSLDEVAKKYNGKTLIQNLLEEKGVIDEWKNSITAWIEANPDKIISFFQSLKKIDFAGFGRGIVDGLRSIAKTVELLSNTFGGAGGKAHALGWFLTIAGPLGRGITTVGGVLKGLSHPLAAIWATIAKGTIMMKGEFKKGGGLFGVIGRMLAGSGKAGEATEAMEEAGKAATAAETAVPKMGKIGTAISKVFTGWTQIATMVGGTAFVTWGSMKLFKGAFKDLGEIVDVVKGIDWDAGSAVLVSMGIFLAGFIKLGTKLGSALGTKGLIGGGIFAGLTLMFSGAFWADMAMIKRGFKAIFDTVKYLNDAIEQLNNIKTIDGVGGVKYKVKNAITTFNQIIDLFQNEGDGSKIDEAQGKTGGTKLQKLSGSVVKTVGGLADALKAMKESIDTLNEISHMKINIGGVTAITPKLRVALQKIGGILTDIPVNLTTEANANEFVHMNTALANAKEAFKSLLGSDGLIAQIPQIVKAVSKLQRSGDFESFANKMEDLGGAIKNILNSLDVGRLDTGKVSTDMSNILSSLNDIKTILGKLKELGGEKIDTKGTDNIKTMITNIASAFDEAGAADLSGQIMTFVIAIETALKEFEKFNEPIEINPTIVLGSDFNRSVNDTTRQISGAKGKIQGAMNKIPSTFRKSITAHFAVNVMVTGLGGAMGKITSGVNSYADKIKQQANNLRDQATGGLRTRNGVLYRSGGGNIFKPRGTDSVPAMLTPGEYVHRKQAVDFFGTDFMQKVNAMDVRGAMNALLTKAGSSTNIGRQSIINNTVNNNQRVTQNINTNNPNFTRVQMGRFAGAL